MANERDGNGGGRRRASQSSRGRRRARGGAERSASARGNGARGSSRSTAHGGRATNGRSTSGRGGRHGADFGKIAGILGTAAVVLAVGAGAYAFIMRREEELDFGGDRLSESSDGLDRSDPDSDLGADLSGDLGSEDLE